MQRCAPDGNAHSLEPDAQFGENIVDEALIARIVGQPVQNAVVRFCDDWIHVCRRSHSSS